MDMYSIKVPTRLTLGEEIANAVSHGVSALLILFAMPVASIVAYSRGGITDLIGVTIFCSSIFFMFLISTLYHAMAYETKHKSVFKTLDHIFIYVAIAGSYTPIALLVIGGWQSIFILALQWTMVVFGIFYKSLSRNSMPKVSLIIYLVMGWTMLIFMPLFFKNSNALLFWLIFTGGLFYSVGAIFYAKKGFKFHHFVWHIFVFLGAITHFIGICFYM